MLKAAKRECSSVECLAAFWRSPCILPAAEKTRSTPAEEAGAAKYCFARQGYASAQCALGRAYANGWGVPQSFERAVELYKQSAAQGHPTAHNNLGIRFLYDGKGVTKNYKEARRLFVLALEQGYTYARKGLDVTDDLIRTECPLLGKRVVITGTSRADLNGKVGVATDFDHAKGRYVVAWGGKGEKSQVMKIKPGNLRLA